MTDLLTAAEAAKLLRTTPDHVRGMARGGGLPHLRMGSRYLFPSEAIDAWIRDRTVYPERDGEEAPDAGQRGGDRLQGRRQVVGWTLDGRPIRRSRFASSESAAKDMLKSIDLKAAQALLRHRAATLTADVYASDTDAARRRAAAALQEALA